METELEKLKAQAAELVIEEAKVTKEAEPSTEGQETSDHGGTESPNTVDPEE